MKADIKNWNFILPSFPHVDEFTAETQHLLIYNIPFELLNAKSDSFSAHSFKIKKNFHFPSGLSLKIWINLFSSNLQIPQVKLEAHYSSVEFYNRAGDNLKSLLGVSAGSLSTRGAKRSKKFTTPRRRVKGAAAARVCKKEWHFMTDYCAEADYIAQIGAWTCMYDLLFLIRARAHTLFKLGSPSTALLLSGALFFASLSLLINGEHSDAKHAVRSEKNTFNSLPRLVAGSVLVQTERRRAMKFSESTTPKGIKNTCRATCTWFDPSSFFHENQLKKAKAQIKIKHLMVNGVGGSTHAHWCSIIVITLNPSLWQ